MSTRNSNYLIRLIRNGAEYRISARRLLLEKPDEVFYVQGGDNIIAEPADLCPSVCHDYRSRDKHHHCLP